MFKALHIKLWRDLWHLRAQALTIGVVVACGVAGFVGEFSTHESLKGSRDAYYLASRFADVFAGVCRAPLALRDRVAALDGVAQVQLSAAFDVQLDLPDVLQSVTARFISLELGAPSVQGAAAPEPRQSLNVLALRSGRWPQRVAQLEAVVSERFAQVRGLHAGSTLVALLNGRRERVHIVGTVLSPEYVYATRGGAPDDQWFGVLWVDAERLATAFDMDGAFNRVALSLDASANESGVIAALDRLLEPYGGIGAVARDKQLSNAIVKNELDEQRVLGTVLPGIFLCVAVFILNVVLSRQVVTQRSQIATLKALGYTDLQIAAHYIALAVVLSTLGTLAGLLFSLWLGQMLLQMYAEVFRFTQLLYHTVPWVVGVSVLVVTLGASLGAFGAIRSVVRLSPAQAMQPSAPPLFKPTLVERLGLARRWDASALMVVRNIERRPWRAAMTVLGIASAVALQISGAFWLDAIAHIVDVQFRLVQQGDVLLNFNRPVQVTSAQDLQRLPGVLAAEVQRNEPVRVRAHGHTVDTVLSGYVSQPSLLRVIDENRGALPMPQDGVMINALLARELELKVGERVQIEFRLWHRRQASLVVTEVVRTMFGKQVFMELDAMNRLAGDGAGATDAALRVDPDQLQGFYAAIKSAPYVAAVADKASLMRSFNESTARNLGFFTTVLTLFAVAMAVGITYNSARIALSERAWELASLRVLGMTRAEVSVLLLSELGLELLVALPLGGVLGYGLAAGLMQLMASENIDFPVVIAPSTYGSAALCVLAAGVASALVVRRHIDRLDLVSVLKLRE